LIYKQRGLFHPYLTPPRASFFLSLSFASSRSLCGSFFTSTRNVSASLPSLPSSCLRCCTFCIILTIVYDRTCLRGVGRFPGRGGSHLMEISFCVISLAIRHPSSILVPSQNICIAYMYCICVRSAENYMGNLNRK